MTRRNTTARSRHELGLASWFGGSPMGAIAIGLNGATAQADNPKERAALAANGRNDGRQ